MVLTCYYHMMIIDQLQVSNDFVNTNFYKILIEITLETELCKQFINVHQYQLY